MSLRLHRKLQNLNVWQRGIQQYRAAYRSVAYRGAAGTQSAGRRSWAGAWVRHLFGRRAADLPTGDGMALSAGRSAGGMLSATATPSQGNVSPAGSQTSVGRDSIDLREGMLTRRVPAPSSHTIAHARMTQAGPIHVAACRDLRLWQRGAEFIAAARGGFELEQADERRAFWRQRARHRVAAPVKRATAGSAHSLRLLLRSLATRQGRDDIGQVAAGGHSVTGHRAAQAKLPQVVAAAAGCRRGRSFRDHQFGRQGLNLLERALKAKAKLRERSPASKGGTTQLPTAAWLPGSASKAIEAPGPKKPQ